jgi:hypothetical protein
MAKKVPVTSVTPASKVKATSKAQQARTRGLVMGIATATPAGRAVKAAATVAKVGSAAKRTKIMADAAKKIEATKVAKTITKKPESSVKVVSARGSSYNKIANQKEAERLARTSRSKTTSSKDLRGSAKQDYEVVKIKVSDNVTARVPAKSNYEFAKDMSRFGKIQKQNAGPLQATKAEAKANARGLKAANKTTKASKVQKKITSTKKMENVPKDVSDRFNATVKRLAAESAKKK